jgi:hypothetical protein
MLTDRDQKNTDPHSISVPPRSVSTTDSALSANTYNHEDTHDHESLTDTHFNDDTDFNDSDLLSTYTSEL